MKLLLPVLLIGATSCGNAAPVPDAQQKYEEFYPRADTVNTGAEFYVLATSLGHTCDRVACDQQCQRAESDLFPVPDELLICRWDEALSGVSDVVFGTVHSVVHLSEDEIVRRDIEIVYIGP